MDRPRAERLHVGSRGVRAPGLLRDRLAQIPAAALVAVADGLLPAADRIGELLGREARAGEQVLQRERAGRLAGEVLEEDRGGEAFVQLVRSVHDAGSAAVAKEGQRAVGGLPPVEVQELKLVGCLHLRVQRVLVYEDAVGAFRPALHGVAPPRPFDLPEGVRSEVAGEDLVRRIGERVLEAAKRGLDLVGSALARGLRPVADEVGRVRQHEGAAVDRRCHRSPTLAAHPAHSAGHARVFRR
jgi:hypothetical protein